MMLFLTCMVLLTGYWLLISYYHLAWLNIPDFKTEVDKHTHTEKISIIIPARNEEATIAKCLQSILQQNYPRHLLEVIVVNDHSTDATAAMVEQHHHAGIILINLADTLKNQPGIIAFKKKAIETGIAAASGTLIVTTDADCSMHENWIGTIAAFRKTNHPAFIAAPVKIKHYNNILSVFQSMDFAILQGITGASVYKNIHSMCNGANLAYEKEAFYAVNGFAGIDNIASGDDMLLMRKITTQYPQRVHYLKSKDVIVDTAPAADWRAFFQQRIRWASKSGQYKDVRIVSVLLLVYLLNLNLLVLLIGSIFQPVWLLFFGVGVFYKTMIEWDFVKTVLKYFDNQKLLRFFPLFQPLHIVYTVIAGFLGSISKYEWKGRRVR